jgi:hypothetical protein
MNKLSLKVEVEIDKFEKRTRDLLITAFEGGVGYWCCIEGYRYPEGTKPSDYNYEPGKYIDGKEVGAKIGKLQPFECRKCPDENRFVGVKGDSCPTHGSPGMEHDYTPRYALIPTLKGGAVRVSDEESGDEHREYTVDYYSLVKAWQICAELYPRVFARIKDENYDANDADVWFQCAVFGEAIYD